MLGVCSNAGVGGVFFSTKKRWFPEAFRGESGGVCRLVHAKQARGVWRRNPSCRTGCSAEKPVEYHRTQKGRSRGGKREQKGEGWVPRKKGGPNVTLPDGTTQQNRPQSKKEGERPKKLGSPNSKGLVVISGSPGRGIRPRTNEKS